MYQESSLLHKALIRTTVYRKNPTWKNREKIKIFKNTTDWFFSNKYWYARNTHHFKVDIFSPFLRIFRTTFIKHEKHFERVSTGKYLNTKLQNKASKCCFNHVGKSGFIVSTLISASTKFIRQKYFWQFLSLDICVLFLTLTKS